MASNRVNLAAGLYFVATPIGSARDITLRCLDILASADVLAAEDTRSLRKLMDIHGVSLDGRHVLAYHDHSGPAVRTRILAEIAAGKSVAYASEAGTPLIADPGFQLGRAVIEEGGVVTAAPGASAILTALTVSGLPTDRFFFAGFAPNSQTARRRLFEELAEVPGTLVFYESPKRISKMLSDLIAVYGADRPAVIARELTKKFEEVLRGTLGELAQSLADKALKGEIVVLVDRAGEFEMSQDELQVLVADALKTSSLKDAVAHVVSQTGLPRRRVYQLALELEKGNLG